MAAPVAELECGTIPAGTVVAEDGSVRVTSISQQFTRTKTEFFDDNEGVNGVRFRNPISTIEMEAEIISRVANSLGAAHPGTEIASLNNFAAEVRGFDPAVGCIVFEEATDESTNTEAPTTSMNFTHYPFAA